MSTKLQSVRGTQDILGVKSMMHEQVMQSAKRIAKLYNYDEIITPIFEFSDVFHRTLGDASDIVMKETYTFEDRDGSSLTLRPEFTASVVRAFITNGLTQTLPQKFFSTGPVLRHERPQKCRYRQFHQINFEFLGGKTHLADVETIKLSSDILTDLGLIDHVTLELNTLGDPESRSLYRAALTEYFAKYQNDLSDDSKIRLRKNPLRILDSKDIGDKKLAQDAPTLQKYLSNEAKKYFDDVIDGLVSLGIEYTLNSKLVRGLDYYSHTVFEFTTNLLGSQGTVLAGGRYDELIQMMGGPFVPSIGFAAGIERLYELMLEIGRLPEQVAPISLIPIGFRAEVEALRIASMLRDCGFCIDHDFGSNIQKRMKRADKIGALFTIIFGDDELDAQNVKVKNMKSGEESLVSISKISTVIKL